DPVAVDVRLSGFLSQRPAARRYVARKSGGAADCRNELGVGVQAGWISALDHVHFTGDCDIRSKTTVCANRFGTAVRLADCQASAYGPAGVFGSATVHQARSVRACTGSAKPRMSSISETLRTTIVAYLSSRYLHSG